MSITGSYTPTPAEYMRALQARNTTNLLESLGSAPIIELPFEDIRDEEWKRGQVVLKQTIRRIAQDSGVLSILPTNQLSRFGAAQAKASTRFWSDMRMQLAGISVPLERYVSGIIFEYEKKIADNYTGATLGELLGIAFGYAWFGPKGAKVFGPVFGYMGAGLEERVQARISPVERPDWMTDEQWEKYSGRFEEATGIDLDNQEGLPNGGIPVVQFFTPNTFARDRIMRMEYNLYGRIMGR